MSNILRKQLTADASHMIHVASPPEMGNDVEIVIFPRSTSKAAVRQESLGMY